MRDKFFLIVGLAVIAGSFYLVLQEPAPEHFRSSAMVKIGQASIKVEVARTAPERSKGLSGRESLPEGEGLLFIFDTPAMAGFWMKDMNFPIDIVWIDESWIVAGVERGVEPQTFPRIFYPPRAVKYVLEVSSGFSEKLGIDTGEFVSYLQ